MEREFGSYRKDRGEKNQSDTSNNPAVPRNTRVSSRGWGSRRLLRTSCRVVNRRFALCYPSAPASGHKWICRLMFQGAEQQMISSSKAKDKETKAPGFLQRKHREQTLCCRANSSGGRRANSITSPVCFSGRETAARASRQKFKMKLWQRSRTRRPSLRRSNLGDNGAANEIAGRSKKKKKKKLHSPLLLELSLD